MKTILMLVAGAALANMSFAEHAPSAAQSVESAGYFQKDERLSAHVHVLRQQADVFTDPVGNVVVIEQSDGLVLVDSGGAFGSGQRVVELVRKISAKPVKAIVLSHYHSDHSLGLSALLEAWPKADVIAHQGTIRAMVEGRPPGVPLKPSTEFEAQKDKRYRETAASIAKQVAEQIHTKEELAGWGRELSYTDVRIADMKRTYTSIPKHAFASHLTLGDRTTPVQILFLGRANTPGDTLVWLPSERILATGDVVVSPIPYMFNVYPAEMLQVFTRMKALPFRTIIPGHGAVQNRHYLEQIEELVAYVRRSVVPLAKKNIPVEKIQSELAGNAFRLKFAGNDPWLRYWFDAYTWNPLIESAWHEARGDPLGPPPIPKPAPQNH